MKKESVSDVLKQMMCALRAIVKRKTRALKARLIIHSLLADTNFLVPSISHKLKLHPLTPTHQNQLELHAVENHQVADHEVEAGVCEYEEKNPDLRHSLRVTLDGDGDEDEVGFEEGISTSSSGGSSSVIEMVKHSKEEAGEEFSLEQDIDHVADLFIRNFHRQMRMQKQQSLKRYQEMLIDGTSL